MYLELSCPQVVKARFYQFQKEMEPYFLGGTAQINQDCK